MILFSKYFLLTLLRLFFSWDFNPSLHIFTFVTDERAYLLPLPIVVSLLHLFYVRWTGVSPTGTKTFCCVSCILFLYSLLIIIKFELKVSLIFKIEIEGTKQQCDQKWTLSFN